ncbi:MAG: restriction endonuclease subunit S, partial [Candidatus Zixiibacteriota bacterium]
MTLNLREIMDQHQIFLGAPDAVQKMRELVLQLAVMGKLTIQDDEDGNARDLLEDLASNRSALIAEKRIRNTRSSVPDVTKPDPFSLPRNWVWCTLDQLGYFLGGKTPSRANPTYWDGTVLWVSPKDMKTGEIFDSELKITERALENAGMTLIPAGSILVVARSGILRRRLPVAIARTRLTVNQDLKALVPYIKGMEKFIALMLLGNEARILRQYVKTGTTVQSLEFDKFRAAKFGLPPLAEQHRIVAKVDELMAECDALEEELTRARELRRRATRATLTVLTAPDQGKVDIRNHWRRLRDNFDGLIQTPESVQELRQTILQLAVMGKLVEQREEDGDARELLERIFLHASERNLNIRAPQEVIGAYPVPQAWAWVRL